MITAGTTVQVLDNTEVTTVKVIRIAKANSRGVGTVGDTLVGSVATCRPGASKGHRRGDRVRGVIVMVKRHRERPGGRGLTFDRNGIVLLKASGEPVGSRVNVARAPGRSRSKGYGKVVGMGRAAR